MKHDENFDPNMRFELKQHEPERFRKGTHNKPTSDEVDSLIIMPSNDDPSALMDRSILCQKIIGGNYVNMPYYHSSYMPMRYPLAFPYGEQGWNDKLPLRGHEEADLRARRTAADIDEPDELHADVEAEEDARPAVGRGGSKGVTQKELYRHWCQVR